MDKLPGLCRDKNGNLEHEVFGWDARKAFEYLRDLPINELSGTVLCDLLDWIRWGSEYGCLWYCDTQELFALIERWEEANPNATKMCYLGSSSRSAKRIHWDQIWPRLKMVNAKRVSICPVHNLQIDEIYEACPAQNCRLVFWDYQERILGPRGYGTYNVESEGVGGWDLAVAAYYSRNWIRLPVDISQEPASGRPLVRVG